MNSVSIDIASILGSESSLDLTLGTNLFISKEPATPDNCVTLFDTSGGIPDLGLRKEEYDRPTLQIRVRNNSYQAAMNVVENIRDVLQGRYGDIVNGLYYTLIRVTIPAYHIGYDDNNRAIVVINFEAQRRKS